MVRQGDTTEFCRHCETIRRMYYEEDRTAEKKLDRTDGTGPELAGIQVITNSYAWIH